MTGTLLNSLIVLGWILWGLSFSEPFPQTGPLPSIDIVTLLLQVAVGVAMPVLACWWHAWRPSELLWPKPRFSMNPVLVLRGKDPTWVFLLSLWFLVMGTSCAAFTLLRGSPFTSFQAMYLGGGAALALGCLIARRVFRRYFGA